MRTDRWTQLSKLAESGPDIQTLFAENPNRFAEFSATLGDMLLDYSKTSLTPAVLSLLLGLAEGANLAAKRDAMFAGTPINATEHRAVLHTALRNPGQYPHPRGRPGHHAGHPRLV